MELTYLAMNNKKIVVDDDGGIVFYDADRLSGVFTWEEVADILNKELS